MDRAEGRAVVVDLVEASASGSGERRALLGLGGGVGFVGEVQVVGGTVCERDQYGSGDGCAEVLGWVRFVVGHQGLGRGPEFVGEVVADEVGVVDRVLVLGERVQDDIGGSLFGRHGLLILRWWSSWVLSVGRFGRGLASGGPSRQDRTERL